MKNLFVMILLVASAVAAGTEVEQPSSKYFINIEDSRYIEVIEFIPKSNSNYRCIVVLSTATQLASPFCYPATKEKD